MPLVAWSKPFMWWGFSVACYGATILIPAAMFHRLEGMAENARCLDMPPKQKQFLLINLQTDVRWKILPLQVNYTTALLLMAPIFVGATCWAVIFSRAAAM